MTEDQAQIFDCLREVAAFAHRNGAHKLQEAVDRAGEAALLEICGIDLANPIQVEDYTVESGEVVLFGSGASA